jgi:hypothetical protein
VLSLKTLAAHRLPASGGGDMLKQFVRAVVLFFSLITSVVSVNAQSRHRFTVHVPFQFILNGQMLPAGNYVIERTDAAKPNIITLTRADSGIVRLVLTQRVEKDNPSTTSSLIFIRREGKHYLFQVWNVGAMNGGQVPSAYERERSDRQRKDLTLVTLRAKRN